VYEALHACRCTAARYGRSPYTPALTRLLLHACAYTPALTRLTRLQVHSGALWKITWKKHRHAILMMAAEMRRPPYPWPQVLPFLTRLLLHACFYPPALTKYGASRVRGLRYCLLSACAEYVLKRALTTFTYAKKKMEKKMRLCSVPVAEAPRTSRFEIYMFYVADAFFLFPFFYM
jgi:hypothetical protein